jgi:[ribosomal protein S5]-alanine N-acetyltransferase
MMKSLVTQRLRLEPLEQWHAQVLFEGLRDARLYRWLDEKPPESLDYLSRRYQRLQTRQSADGSEIWLNWVILSVTEGRYIGYVQATIRGRTASVAYVLFADAQGKGFAREAVASMIQELVGSYNVADVFATVDRHNQRSCALLSALNFVQVMDAEAVAGLDKDEMMFKMLAS